jgi:hypothetical protein
MARSLGSPIVEQAGEGITAMTTIHADELQPGDAVVWDGRKHTITSVDRRDGWAWPIALDGTGWGIALDHHLIHVDRRAA